jgi:lactate permease
MQSVLAALPIGLVIVTMVLLRWRAAYAGLLGLAAALLLAIGVFGLGGEPPSYPGAFNAVGGATLEALFTTAIILWIIFPALCIYEMQSRTGAFEVMRGGLAQLSDDRRVQVLLMGWFFGLFLEGVAGFGAPVALAAPILVGLGFPPIKAVVLALIGHAAGVSFGAVGAPVLPQMAATGLSGVELARPAALLHALLGWLLVGALFVMADPGQRPRLADVRWPALAAILFIAPFLALAWWTGPELPTVGGAVVGGALFAIVVARTRAGAGQEGPRAGAMAKAALPYLVLVALILATRMIWPLREALQQIEISWRIDDAFHGSMAPLYHPGTLLFASFVLGGLLQGRTRGDLLGAMAAAARRLGVVALALAAMLGWWARQGSNL